MTEIYIVRITNPDKKKDFWIAMWLLNRFIKTQFNVTKIEHGTTPKL